MDFLILTLITPFIGAFFAYICKNKAGFMASIFSLITLLFGLFNFFEISISKIKIYYNFSLFKWLNSEINFGLICDPLTSILLILIIVIGFLVILYSAGYMSPLNADHQFYKPLEIIISSCFFL